MPFCPIRSKEPKCDVQCAWFRPEIGACAIWAVPELLANIAAIRAALEDHLLEHHRSQDKTEIDLPEEL